MPGNGRLNLANLFYDKASQCHLIAMMVPEYDKLVKAQKPYSPCVIYGPPRSEDLKRPTDQTPPKTNTDLSGLLKNTNPTSDFISLE